MVLIFSFQRWRKSKMNIELKRVICLFFVCVLFYLISFISQSKWFKINQDHHTFRTVMLEKTPESPLGCKEIKPVHPKGNQSRIFIGWTDAEAEALILWPPNVKSQLIGKDPDAGKDRGQEEKEVTWWDGWMASPTQWTWVSANSGSQWLVSAVHGVTTEQPPPCLSFSCDFLSTFDVLGTMQSLRYIEM